MLVVHKTIRAVEDLINCAEYIGRDSPRAAARFLKAAESTFELLARNPEIGITGELLAPKLIDLRRWRVKSFTKYLVFYRIAAGRIEIVRVVHGARDLEAMFSD